MTIIICGTLIVITAIALMFAMWVINKGVKFEEDKRG
jgi:hypothetical protein